MNPGFYKKTMASVPILEEAMVVADSGRSGTRSIRFDRSLERSDPIDQVGSICGTSQVRVLGQRRRTRLIRVDPDDGE